MQEDYFERILIKLARRYKNINSNHVISFEDVLSEAKLAAILAIRTYREDKKAMLKTYVYNCVKHRLIGLAKKQNHRADHNYYSEIEEIEDHHREQTSLEELDFDLHMRKLLSKDEYLFYFLSYVRDFSQPEIKETLQWNQSKINRLSFRIRQKFIESDESLMKKFLSRKLKSSENAEPR